MPVFLASEIVQMHTLSELSPEVKAAYEAPFPDARYQVGARQFPLLIPISPDDPATESNRNAFEEMINAC
jgi:haloalkane dehalogenase